ncbi:hypothetical protein [Halostagnicola sp. A-GB9-2]|uniref:hypothetical protein n=1 Tax=Halostagnicola sp. A-GB9-2 TaxID=3048066 RepID=UPI0024BF78C3|nr:hypothetical protein [Halostagnicola sp. A-GB9-2]MDJ1431978.1 hypothetical protein [Halostagnicola sp. A-GB9-2]
MVVLQWVPYNWDIGSFHSAGVDLIQGSLPTASTTVTSFGTFQGLLYVAFGVNTTVVSIANSFIAVLIPIPVVYLASKLYGDILTSTRGLVALVLFLPLPFFFLTIPMRDALSTFTVLCTLALIVHVLSTRDVLMGLPLACLLAVTYLLRPEWGMVLFLGFLAGATIVLYNTFEIQTSYPTLLATGGLLGGLGFVLFAEFMYSFDRVNAELSYRSSGGAVYLEGMQYSSWLDFLVAAPGRAIYFQFAPFPMHIETVYHALAFISTVYIVVFVISAARSLYVCETDEVVLVILLVVYLAGITGYGLINSNFGTNVRHRIPFTFLLLVFAAPVIQRWELSVRHRLSVWPDENQQHGPKQREAEKLDGDV